jgi:hypothetical protein
LVEVLILVIEKPRSILRLIYKVLDKGTIKVRIT